MNKITIHVELSGTFPLEREQTLLAASPPWHSAGECTSLCVHGGGGKVLPLLQHCTLPAHEEATLSLSLLPLPWPLPLQSPLPPPLLSLSPLPLLSTLPLPIAIAVAVGHFCCSCHCPSLPPSLLRRCQPSPSLLPLPSTIAVSVTIGNYSCHLNWPSPLPLPLPIAESCCLGVARIVFEQLKQIMLTLFYFVWTVGRAHWSKPDDWPGVKRQWPTPALGSKQQAASGLWGKWLAAGGQQGGDVAWSWEVLFCWVVGLPAIDRWHLWWCVGCGRRHCRWDSDWTDARRKRDYRKIWFRQENVYVRKNQKDVTHRVIRCAKKHCQCDNNENDAQGSRNLQKIFSSQRNMYLGRN